MKFYQERVVGYTQELNTTIELANDEEWHYFHTVRMIIGSEGEFDWFPENVGSFFTDQLLKMIKPIYKLSSSNRIENRQIMKSLSEQFDMAFTIPKMNISILNFAYLHTMNDFRQLFVTEDIGNKLEGSGFVFVDNDERIVIKDYMANFPSAFYKCFNQEMSYFKQMASKTTFDDEGQEATYMLKSPCISSRHIKICEEYCQWSRESHWSNFFSKKEFRSLMKYALPQAKIPNDQDESEYEMAAKIVGKGSLKKKPKVAPVPLVILCKYQKDNPWEGQDIGMNAKFCDSFMQAPSDVGLCISGGMKTTEIFNSNIHGNDRISRKIKGGTYTGSGTFFLDTDNGDRPQSMNRSMDSPVDEIQMLIHPPNEMAQILHDENQYHSTRSFTLKRGHEYTFEVSIDGRIVTKNFKELPLDKRNCRLRNEVEQTSWFKSYAKGHCKFQCRAMAAYNTCGCIPWDIYHVGTYPECDVFGRTCFMNVMENITHTPGICEECFDDCQYLRYRFEMIDVVTDTIQGSDGEKMHVDLFHYQGCRGIKDLCNYLNDKNHTLNDKYFPGNADQEARLHGMIVVNIVFPQYEADLTVMDVRYTLIDKIASLGGSFGLFTQFTGCSIIAIIHLTILTSKQMYALLKDLKIKFFNQG